ncbi:MAG: PAS/PAC sensor hybrid histidine kinase [uncultured bacterium]|nr:MAG: PAS/PAC sensor hybrid histidine kinase [uncultured bacterium]
MKDFQQNYDEFHGKSGLNISLLQNFKTEYIFQQLPIGIAIIDPASGKFLFINSSFAQILGYTEEELLKKTFQSITHPEDLNKNLELHEKLLKGETDSYNIEKRNVRKDGVVIWVDLTVIRLKDKKSRREFHLGTIFDLSVRKFSEQQIKVSEELFRTVISNAPISIFATDKSGIFTLHEGKAIERVGMKAGENVGSSAYELFAGLEVIEHNGQVTTGKSILDRVSNGEYLSGITEMNGVVFDNKFAPIWDNNGKVNGLLGVATDITEQKRMENERLEFETRYRMLFNEIDEGFCIIEMIFDENQNPIDYCFLEINPAFEKQTGLKDAYGKRMRELEPLHEKYWFEIYGRIALTGVPERFVNRAEQLHRWYDVYAFRFGQSEKHQVAILFNDITERKLVIEKLQQSEHNLAEAERIGNSGSWDYNVTTDKASWSKNMFRIFDVDPEIPKELVFKNFVENLVHPEDKEHVLSVFQDAVTGKRPYNMEYRIIHKDGKIRNVRAIAETLFDERGHAMRMIGKVEDITELKKRGEEFRYRAEIASNISDGIMLNRKKDGIIVHTNRRFEEMFGYGHGELIGKHVAILNAPGSNRNATQVDETIIKSVHEKGKWKGVVQNAKKDGSIFWSQASVSQFEHSSFGRVLISVQMDITEQVQAEMALHENEIRQRAMISNISDVIAIIDKQGINQFISANVEKWFGWMPDELIGQNTFNNIHPDDQKRIKDDFYSLFAKPGKIVNTECRYQCKDNSYKWIELTAVNRLSISAIYGVLVNYHDISQRKMAVEKLIRHGKELKLLSNELINVQEKEKKILARELHDEIGQALTAMKINLSSVLKNIPNETHNLAYERIRETDELLNTILTRVHDISLNLHPAILEILGFIKTIKSYAQQFEKRTGIKVRVIDDFKSNLNTEQEINLFRIVQEALTNVAKHADAQNVEICFDSGNRWFVLTIKDDGKGFTANPNIEMSENAPGIGLIGMNERVNAMQGKFRISSRPRKGTKIQIKVLLYGKGK